MRLNKSLGRVIVVILALTSASGLYVVIKVFQVMDKALSGKLTCIWTGLVEFILAILHFNTEYSVLKDCIILIDTFMHAVLRLILEYLCLRSSAGDILFLP